MLLSQKGVAPVWTIMWPRCWLCCPEPCVQADRVENMSALQRFDSFLPMRLEANATGQTVLFLSRCNLRLSFLTIREGTRLPHHQTEGVRDSNHHQTTALTHAPHCLVVAALPLTWPIVGACDIGVAGADGAGVPGAARLGAGVAGAGRGRVVWWTRCSCCNRWHRKGGVATRGAGALDTRILADVAFDGSAGVAGAATLGVAGTGGTGVAGAATMAVAGTGVAGAATLGVPGTSDTLDIGKTGADAGAANGGGGT